jgi:GNAT superfamily N-acetyltransferase
MTARTYEWRGAFTNDELNSLHAEAFNHPLASDDWVNQLQNHSLGWVCARSDGELIGFVNVAWDGGAHAFVLDTMVRADHRRLGVGAALVSTAVERARAAGCEWLHVDFPESLSEFYFAACNFKLTQAGLISLRADG